MERTIAQRANQAILKWSEGREKLVVGIDGYSGIGKTALLNTLSAMNTNIVPVHRDDFNISRTAFQQRFTEASDKLSVFETGVLDREKLLKLIAAFRSGQSSYTTTIENGDSGRVDKPCQFDLTPPVLVIEGIFLFHPESIGTQLDYKIFLDGDRATADRRRVAREKARWGSEYFPEDHPDSYFRMICTAFDRYVATQHPEDRADLVLDMTS